MEKDKPSSTAQKQKKSKPGMFSGIVTKLKKIKHIEFIIAAVFVGLVLAVYFWSDAGLFGGSSNAQNNDSQTGTSGYAEEVENRLKTLLSSIRGAGDCEVMINLESTPELVIAYIESSTNNASTDGSGNGSENTVKNSSPVILSQAGVQLPLVLKELTPKVLGVVVVSAGAADTKTRLNIISAVSVLFDISPDKIAVFEKK